MVPRHRRSLGALAFTQNIPQVLTGEITLAYTDTDGNGERADQRPPGAASYFAEVDETITSQLGRDRDDIVVLTADTTFLAYYPYYGFQALTSHYANPLADFPARAAAIAEWSELGTPDELLAAWDAAPWRAPDAVVFRQNAKVHAPACRRRVPERPERAPLHGHIPEGTVRRSAIHRDRGRSVRRGHPRRSGMIRRTSRSRSHRPPHTKMPV